ncbi:putative pentatricopeptide repeat-containing protein At3g01580 isoform X2 [Malania oleifera]|uniref:putative pentatricopeptide repeat-containing protein At3g01580 isoform X2 n=1 Tax=Malania oleifera TaxID=397392 RepID=UPI0025AE6CCB|nr:putative pentatricopeptide repeat-containing protein At3g01580 isoform X2 [Malania oleifera]
MAFVRPPNSSVQYLPTTSNVPHYIIKHVLYSKRTPSIYCSRKFRNCCTSLQFQDNPCQKSIIKPDSLYNPHLLDVSSVKNIKEYIEYESFDDAIRIYIEMLEHGVPLENFQSFPSLIKAFGGLSDEEKGRQIYGHLLKLGILDDIYVANSLLSMFWKCGAVDDALQLFEKMPERDQVSWNTMISGFHQSRFFIDSLMVFRRMVWEFSIQPNRVACISALSSCASLESLIHGREIHGFVVKCGLGIDEFLINGLIDMYMKCGEPLNAERVFNSDIDLALELFIEMLMSGMRPDSSTMVAVLVLCSQLMDMVVGRQIHGFIFRVGLDNDVRVQTALLDMYFKCGDTEVGLKIFEKFQSRNLVMWGAVILKCAQGACPIRALELFDTFRLVYEFADSVILLAVLRACSLLTLKPKGIEIHGLAVKMGLHSDVFVGGALVDMYAKCRDMESAQKVFFSLPAKDLISWNALISGYAQNECADEALRAFLEMQSEKIRPNAVTAACILSICAYLSVMNLCKVVHGWLIRHGFELNVLVSNSLIATYAKCGDINSSWAVFKRMTERNEVSWNSIISGFGMHGHIDEMFDSFEKMKASDMKPDHVTFTAILSACSHAGRVDKGWKYFKSMVEDYELEPHLEQYTCMVDLLGRAGHLTEAYDLIMAMFCAPDDRIWGSLLGSCKSHGNERLAEVVANHIFKLDSNSIGYHVLLANLYEDFGKWNEVNQVRSKIKGMELKKRPGCSWIEIDNKIHIFIAGDKSHCHSQGIYTTIENLTAETKRVGYIPQLHSANFEVDIDHDGGLISSRFRPPNFLFLQPPING